jgi:hypothetical protein
MVMSRYNQFDIDDVVRLDRSHVVCHYEASEPFKKYYEVTLEHIKVVRDISIIDDLNKTTQYIRKTLDSPSGVNFVDMAEYEGEVTEDDEELLMDFMSTQATSNTVH